MDDDDDPAESDPIGTRGDRDRPGMGRAVPGPRRRPSRARRTLADIELDLARAEARDERSAEIRARQELIHRYSQQAEALERRKNLTTKQKDRLRALYGLLAAEEAALDSMRADQEQSAAAAREERARKREEAQRKAEERMNRIQEAAARASEPASS